MYTLAENGKGLRAAGRLRHQALHPLRLFTPFGEGAFCELRLDGVLGSTHSPGQNLWIYLAEIGRLEGYYLTIFLLPHNTHRRRPTPGGSWPNRTGAMRYSSAFLYG
jgi:hypothetical protein